MHARREAKLVVPLDDLTPPSPPPGKRHLKSTPWPRSLPARRGAGSARRGRVLGRWAQKIRRAKRRAPSASAGGCRGAQAPSMTHGTPPAKRARRGASPSRYERSSAGSAERSGKQACEPRAVGDSDGAVDREVPRAESAQRRGCRVAPDHEVGHVPELESGGSAQVSTARREERCDDTDASRFRLMHAKLNAWRMRRKLCPLDALAEEGFMPLIVRSAAALYRQGNCSRLGRPTQAGRDPWPMSGVSDAAWLCLGASFEGQGAYVAGVYDCWDGQRRALNAACCWGGIACGQV